MLGYLDERYKRTISHQKLIDFLPQFPRFYDAISKFMQKDSIKHLNDNSSIENTGLNFCPFPIFGFIDCSIDKISRPRSGPNGDFFGTPRHKGEDDAQRSVYTAYKKLHGIKVETVLLPNGISTVFGPCSARIHDVGGVLQMSGLDNFLCHIQQGAEHVYCAFGDGAYAANHLRCKYIQRYQTINLVLDLNFLSSNRIGIRSYYQSLIPGVDITPAQRLCNERIMPCRQTIEHGYGDVENIFRICSRPESLRIGQNNSHACRQLRVCHLLVNVYVCLNGNKASSFTKFNCPPPSLKEYLQL